MMINVEDLVTVAVSVIFALLFLHLLTMALILNIRKSVKVRLVSLQEENKRQFDQIKEAYSMQLTLLAGFRTLLPKDKKP